MRQLLSGIRVVELAEGVAGSYCGKLFADLGAEVVKAEGPGGDPLRRLGDAGGGPGQGRGGAFLHLNSNKRSTVVDGATEDGRRRLRQLVERSHLVIEATGRGRLQTFGLTWQDLHARVPGLSVVHVSGFGSTGPYADYRWDDLIVQAVAGALLRVRGPGGPVRLPGSLALCFVGNVAALGALAAVVHAEATGVGSLVDCAASEALATLPSRVASILAHQYAGGEPVASRTPQAADTLIPTGVYPCADGYMAMMSTPQQLGEMLEVLDDDDLREAFARPDAFERGETKEAVDAALYPWLLSRTRAEATAAAQRAGWPLAGVNLPAEVLEADHLRQRNFWVHCDDPRVGALDLPGAPWRFDEGGWSLRRLAPGLGADDAEIEATLKDARADAPLVGTDAPLVGTDAPAPSESVPGVGSPRDVGGPPLSGIRVVDLTAVWSGPYATMLLADLGAEVIRVENPWVLPPTTKGYQARPTHQNLGYLGSLYGPPAPGRPDRPFNRHALNNSLARNKRSCTIDTRRAEGRELVLRLAERSDVFIDNFKANGLARIGIELSELRERNPRLIVVRMPPTGLAGDWSTYTGFGAQFDGLTGLLSLCGHRDSDLTTSPATTYMDGASGPAAAFATVAALRYRAGTGRGQLVEFAQSENILNHLGDVFVDLQLGVDPRRWGNRDPERAPQGLYPCAGEDQWLAVSVGDDETWRRLAEAIGRPDLLTDARFADAAGRHRHHDELDQLIGSWTADQPPQEAFHTLQRAGVPAGPLLDDTRFAADPQIVERQWLRPLESLDVGTHLHPGTPYRGVPQVWDRGSPVLGEDNDYVYKEILGVSETEFEQYRADKILADDYLDPSGQPY
ncbi:MAG TPA: CoA transferase [Acidimicrobiales bacterium]